MASKKRVLVENPKCNQFIEQSFPVIEKSICDSKFKYVQVVSYNGKRTFLCTYFKVEVVKDYDGFITFLVTGDPHHENNDDLYISDVWIMRTDDFNRAYDLKNKLNALLGHKPSDRALMPCYGSLRREKTWLD